MPPKEWPIRIGLRRQPGDDLGVVGDDVVDAVVGDRVRVLRGPASTVSGSPGQPGADGVVAGAA